MQVSDAAIAAGTFVAGLLAGRKRNRARLRQAEAEADSSMVEAIEDLKRLVVHLQHENRTQAAEMAALQLEHSACQSAYAELKAEIATLREQVQRLTGGQ